jgi:hypothetical protein
MRTLDADAREFPSSQEYRDAFAAVREQITVNQLLILQRHYHAPGRTITARRLAEYVGYANYGGVNLQYGALAKLVADALHVQVEVEQLFLLVSWTRAPSVEDGELLLIMRP